MNEYTLRPASAEGDGYTIVENAPLQARNTFRVPARAALLIDVHKPAALPELFRFATLRTRPLLVLGEGSNVLFTRDWPDVVLSMATRGISVLDEDRDRTHVRVEAGENWNDLVRWSLAKGLCGLENLVLIPGTVGAAPIQNIGAYGVEVCEFITAVEAWDRLGAHAVRLTNSDCAFTYRDSIFKRDRERYIVCAVEFELPRQRDLCIDYAGVRAELAALDIGEPCPAAVAEAVARLRMRKLPNPALIGNAGSFFKNPLVTPARAAALRADFPGLPAWTGAHGATKLSAAWMIECCGFKGLREGDAQVSEQHALVLVNLGAATGAQVWALAARVRAGVRARFDIELESEPLIV